jgi:hypothetical protein
MRMHLGKPRDVGEDARKRHRRVPDPWWWTKAVISVLLMAWRTIIWWLTWHN